MNFPVHVSCLTVLYIRRAYPNLSVRHLLKHYFFSDTYRFTTPPTTQTKRIWGRRSMPIPKRTAQREELHPSIAKFKITFGIRSRATAAAPSPIERQIKCIRLGRKTIARFEDGAREWTKGRRLYYNCILESTGNKKDYAEMLGMANDAMNMHHVG